MTEIELLLAGICGTVTKEQVAIAKRMQVIRPVLLNNSTTFEVVVDNEIAAKDFTALIPELQLIFVED